MCDTRLAKIRNDRNSYTEYDEIESGHEWKREISLAS